MVQPVFCAPWKREYVYLPNHPHYVDPEVYKKIMNSINKKLSRKLKGKIIILNGKTHTVNLQVMNGIHSNWEERQHICNKIKGAIKLHYEQWAAKLN